MVQKGDALPAGEPLLSRKFIVAPSNGNAAAWPRVGSQATGLARRQGRSAAYDAARWDSAGGADEPLTVPATTSLRASLSADLPHPRRYDQHGGASGRQHRPRPEVFAGQHHPKGCCTPLGCQAAPGSSKAACWSVRSYRLLMSVRSLGSVTDSLALKRIMSAWRIRIRR